MRLSKAFIPTLKEIPAEAITTSHKLMLRAGMIRSLAAGIYSYLPLFYRVVLKVEEIIRQEMNSVGAQELHLPALNPVEVWEESGRQADFGQDKFNFPDRRGHPMTLAPTHEEIISDLARHEIRSYKDLPQVWYQIQTKFRDEPRPRAGVMRSRQFIMKDAYSLDADWEGLDRSYEDQKSAYKKIFARCGLDFFIVGASSGLMGGEGSQEFMVQSPYGEDTCVICDICGYSANIEVAISRQRYKFGSGGMTPAEVHTPGYKSIAEVSQFLHQPPELFVKALLYIAVDEPVMVLIGGPDELSESKLATLLKKPARAATPEEVMDYLNTPAGYIGPVGLPANIKLLCDETLRGAKGMVCGANKENYHLINVDIGIHTRPPDLLADLRTVQDGEGCPNCGKQLKIIRAIELGHIFKLGTKYSLSMGATFLDRKGQAQPIIMGSYGIGIERIIATHIEQWADEAGICWRGEIAPYKIAILPLNSSDDKANSLAEKLYSDLNSSGYETALDDRPLRAGVKFKDADLLGIPLQIILGKKLEEGLVELKFRRSGDRSLIPIKEIIPAVGKKLLEI